MLTCIRSYLVNWDWNKYHMLIHIRGLKQSLAHSRCSISVNCSYFWRGHCHDTLELSRGFLDAAGHKVAYLARWRADPRTLQAAAGHWEFCVHQGALGEYRSLRRTPYDLLPGDSQNEGSSNPTLPPRYQPRLKAEPESLK